MTANEGLLAVAREAGSLSLALDGPVEIVRNEGARDRPFSGVRDEISETAIVSDLRALEELAGDPSVRLLDIQLSGYIDGTTHDHVTVSSVYISDEAARLGEAHPVALRLDAEAWGVARPTQRRRRSRRSIVAPFLTLVDAIAPAYASITVEYDLPPPTDLLLYPDQGDGAFRVWWLRNGLFGESDSAVVGEYLRAGAHAQPTRAGMFLSCSGMISPQEIGLAYEEGFRLSEMTGSTIARLLGLSNPPYIS